MHAYMYLMHRGGGADIHIEKRDSMEETTAVYYFCIC